MEITNQSRAIMEHVFLTSYFLTTFSTVVGRKFNNHEYNQGQKFSLINVRLYQKAKKAPILTVKPTRFCLSYLHDKTWLHKIPINVSIAFSSHHPIYHINLE